MKLNLMAAAAACAAVALSVSAAQAATVTYTLSGVWDGSFNGQSIDGKAFAFTMVGDTDLITTVGNAEFLDTLSSQTLTIDGLGPFTVTNPLRLVHVTDTGVTYLNQLTPNLRQVFGWQTAGSPVSLLASFAAVGSTITENTSDIIPTTGGPLVFDLKVGGPQLVFSAVVASVPEPASWTMMTLGFGGLGAMLRRRRRTVAYA
jgi:hypothetical protein